MDRKVVRVFERSFFLCVYMDWEDKKRIAWANAGSFEWSQTIDDVKIRFQLPETTRSRNIDYALTAGTLRVGVKGWKRRMLFSGKLGTDVF